MRIDLDSRDRPSKCPEYKDFLISLKAMYVLAMLISSPSPMASTVTRLEERVVNLFMMVSCVGFETM